MDTVDIMGLFSLETELELRISQDPEWQEGASRGDPHGGHPESMVAEHIGAVLANIDRHGWQGETRRRLRLIALVHDTMKYQAREVGEPHGRLARRFAERYMDDPGVLTVIEHHEAAFKAYRQSRKDVGAAARAITELRELVGEHHELYLAFYRADSGTPGKDEEPYPWFASRWARSTPPRGHRARG